LKTKFGGKKRREIGDVCGRERERGSRFVIKKKERERKESQRRREREQAKQRRRKSRVWSESSFNNPFRFLGFF